MSHHRRNGSTGKCVVYMWRLCGYYESQVFTNRQINLWLNNSDQSSCQLAWLTLLFTALSWHNGLNRWKQHGKTTWIIMNRWFSSDSSTCSKSASIIAADLSAHGMQEHNWEQYFGCGSSQLSDEFLFYGSTTVHNNFKNKTVSSVHRYGPVCIPSHILGSFLLNESLYSLQYL